MINNRITYKFLVLYLILAALVCKETMASKTVSSEKPIPVALKLLITGWEANFSQIRSIKAQAKFRTEDVKFQYCRDLEDKTYKDQNAKIKIWKDGKKLRTDIVYDRIFNLRDYNVKYNLPYGEFAMPTREWEKKKLDITRKHGVMQTTLKMLRLTDKQCNYFVESKDVTIDKAADFFPGPSACEWITQGRILGSETFPEYIIRKAKSSSTKSLEVEDLGSGRYAVNQKFIGTLNEKKFSGTTRIVVNALQGYTVESFKRKAGDQIMYDAEYKYEQKGNVWVIVGGIYKRYDCRGEDNNLTRTTSLTVDADSLKVNEQIGPEVFTFEALNIRKGSLVRDSVADKEYLFNKVPAYLKGKPAKVKK
jgi:hypothetical protein